MSFWHFVRQLLGSPGFVAGWQHPTGTDTLHAVVDEQNIAYGSSDRAQLMKDLHASLKTAYKKTGYRRVVIHAVTKVPAALHTYSNLISKDFLLYVAGTPQPACPQHPASMQPNPPKPRDYRRRARHPASTRHPASIRHHAMRGYDDMLALLVAAELYRERQDIVILSNDRFRDLDEFVKIAPFVATRYGPGPPSVIKIVPANHASDLTLFHKLNDGYFTKKTDTRTDLF